MTHHERLGRQSAFHGLMKMFNLSTSPNLTATGDEEALGELDEPPDNISPRSQSKLLQHLPHQAFIKSPRMPSNQTESLLTKALKPGPEGSLDTSHQKPVARDVSAASMTSSASTADLVSDSSESPTRTATPSPPLPPQYNNLPPPRHIKFKSDLPGKTSVPAVAKSTETHVEANLGRKRCISFASRPMQKKEDAPKVETTVESAPEPPKRKSALRFACPTRTSSSETAPHVEPQKSQRVSRPMAPPDAARPSADERQRTAEKTKKSTSEATPRRPISTSGKAKSEEQENSEAVRFHEFASSNDEDDAWVNETLENKTKITLDDYMKKENMIRQLGKEAEEEAEEDEKEAEELEEELDEAEQEDDFAPSDDDLSDGSDAGNESDNEAGFAESDDDSDAGSDDIFWAPSTTTAATSTEHVDHIRPLSSRRASSVSTESADSDDAVLHHRVLRHYKRPEIRKIKMRPGTPDLPDSTDFVCGTLDEDRPLEAAYISCIEQRRRAKHILIPQDIDPSFPTTDPEDNLDEEDEVDDEEPEEPEWLRGQFDEISNETYRGRHRQSSFAKRSPKPSPKRVHSPAPLPKRVHSPAPKHKRVHSPAPKTRGHRSPAPPQRHLFGQSPRRFRSPPPHIRIRSPPGTRRTSVENGPRDRTPVPVGITITRLGHRPTTTQTASLPHTPNPYFREYRNRGGDFPRVASILPALGGDDDYHDRHVRGAIDIVIGLEKKRQKRKEKFWRQHCRKAAKEQAERKTIPGKGAERMRELGLECAERNRGYGLVQQQTQLVLSL